MSKDAYEDIAQNLSDKMKSTLTPANDGVFSKNCPGVVTAKADAANEKYFVLAKVDENEVRAYVDLGSQCVTIQREDADQVEIKCTVMEKLPTIEGYGSGRVTPCGEANVNLTVDQVTANVLVLIVPNESQAIPIIVGQPFTKQRHVTVVRRRNTVGIFEEKKNLDESDDTIELIDIPDLPRCPACLWAKKLTVVPPNYVGFVKPYVTGSEPNADVFVNDQPRGQEGQDHCLPCCVVNADAGNETCISAMHVSYEAPNIQAIEWAVRSEVYYLNEGPMQDVKSSCSATQPC
ncbi:hypothetical protein MRX96_057172 [Rhipicephalus microplus]